MPGAETAPCNAGWWQAPYPAFLAIPPATQLGCLHNNPTHEKGTKLTYQGIFLYHIYSKKDVSNHLFKFQPLCS